MNKLHTSLLILILGLFVFQSKAFAAELILSPDSLVVENHDQSFFDVRLDPEDEKIIGVDIYLNYDSRKIHILDVVNSGSFSTLPVVKNDEENGLLKFALINEHDTYVETSGVIARIRFEALQEDYTTTVSFDYTYGKSQDTNVINDTSNDVLDSVGEIKIASSSDDASTQQITAHPSPSVSPAVLAGTVSGGNPKLPSIIETVLSAIDEKEEPIISPLASDTVTTYENGNIIKSNNTFWSWLFSFVNPLTMFLLILNGVFIIKLFHKPKTQTSYY